MAKGISLLQKLPRARNDSQKYGLIWDILYVLDELNDEVSMHPANIYFDEHQVTCTDQEPIDYNPPEVIFNEKNIKGIDKHYYSFGIIAYDIMKGSVYGDQHNPFEYLDIRASRSSLFTKEDVAGIPFGNALILLTSFDDTIREKGFREIVDYFFKNVDCQYKLSYRFNNQPIKEEYKNVKTSVHELKANQTITDDKGKIYYIIKDVTFDYRPGKNVLNIEVSDEPFDANKIKTKDLRLYTAYDDGYEVEVLRLGGKKARRTYRLVADQDTTYDFFLKYQGEQAIIEPISFTIPKSDTGEVTLLIDYKDNATYFTIRAGNNKKVILYDNRVEIGQYL